MKIVTFVLNFVFKSLRVWVTFGFRLFQVRVDSSSGHCRYRVISRSGNEILICFGFILFWVGLFGLSQILLAVITTYIGLV